MNPEKRKILPGIAFGGYASRYKKPEISEGFQDMLEVSFKVSAADRCDSGPYLMNICSFVAQKRRRLFGLVIIRVSR